MSVVPGSFNDVPDEFGEKLSDKMERIFKEGPMLEPESANEKIGTFARAFWRNSGGSYTEFLEEDYETLIDCLLGREPREAITLTGVLGYPVTFRPSELAMVFLSTPEVRRASYERTKLWEAEERECTGWED